MKFEEMFKGKKMQGKVKNVFKADIDKMNKDILVCCDQILKDKVRL